MQKLTSLLLVLVAAAAALLSAPAAPALAARDQTMLFEAPPDLLSASLRPAALQKLDGLGVRALRVVLLWRDVAPNSNGAVKPHFDATDPGAYNWGEYDALLQAAAQRKWQILLTVSGPVPRWATPGGVDYTTRPDQLEFKRFMIAVGRHYGQQVKLFSIWNEPNHPAFLDPQFVGGEPASPRIYRGLYQAGYAGLQASGNFSGMKVLMGETAPRGSGGKHPSGPIHDVAPLRFMRGALCLNSHWVRSSSCSMLPTDGWAHHGYATSAGPFFKLSSREPDDVVISGISRLGRALDRASRAGALPSNVPIYLTEFGVQSVPSLNGVSFAQQAEYLAISERIAWLNSRVKFFSQYLLRDEVNGRSRSPLRLSSGFDTGLETVKGKAKPSLSEWPIPLAVLRSGGRVSLWGLARPAQGQTQVQVETADRRGSFKPLLTATTDAQGYWTSSSAFRSGRRWRVRWTSSSGRTYVGPAIRAYTSSGRPQR